MYSCDRKEIKYMIGHITPKSSTPYSMVIFDGRHIHMESFIDPLNREDGTIQNYTLPECDLSTILLPGWRQVDELPAITRSNLKAKMNELGYRDITHVFISTRRFSSCVGIRLNSKDKVDPTHAYITFHVYYDLDKHHKHVLDILSSQS